MNLKERNFLKLMDFTPEEITYMIDLAADLKAKKKQGIPHDSLTGKNIALIFEKTSTEESPWYIVPADNKWYTRYVVSLITRNILQKILLLRVKF